MRDQIIGLLSHLNELDSGKLVSSDLKSYVDKIWANSKIISVLKEGVLQGFISYYENDTANEQAFLTMIALDPRFQGAGLGKILIQASIRDLKTKGFRHYKLKVEKSNKKAQALYESLGFKVENELGTKFLMNLDLWDV